MYYLPTSSLILFFLFSLFYPFPCASSQKELEWCQTLFQCGNITAGFPFWGGNRYKHCGHPLLELHCLDNDITSLTISDHLYHVLHIDHTYNTLRLARTDFLESICSSTFTNTTLPPEIFDLSPTYENVMLYRCLTDQTHLLSYPCPGKGPISVSVNPEYHHDNCHASFTVNVPTNFVREEKMLTIDNLLSVLGEGFEVKVKVDAKACQECLSSHKYCGFNESLPLEVKCGPLLPLPD